MMNKKKKISLLAALTLAVLLSVIFYKNTVMTVRAQGEGTFSIEAQMLPSDNKTYGVKLTVENQGEDWEGTVRLIVDEDYRKPTAYDTALSLPQGSKKQFDVKIPMNSIDSANGTVVVTLLDRSNVEVAKREFKRLLVDQMEALSMGILSDSYSELTYLDMGGSEIYFYDGLYPIRLVELQQGNLEDILDTLTILVIDHYNTGILTKEEIDAIERWNINGGVLIVGTGAYAEDTLKGFNDIYLGISCTEIYTPEETSETGTEADMETGAETDTETDTENNTETDTVTYYGKPYKDWSQLTMARLQGVNSMNFDYNTESYAESKGNGSICALPYSLTQMVKVDGFFKNFAQEAFVSELLENASSYASSRYTSSSSPYGGFSTYTPYMLGVFGNSNSILNFNWLNVIVILYVIFVGPVLYLILRFMKRRELYWVLVPVSALLGIGLVFLAGRGFEVVSTKVYSVAVNNLSDSGKSVTYLHCYDANRKEWELKLAEGYEYAGPLSSSYYYSGLEDAPYYYHIRKAGDTLSVGINPGSNFEDSYFYLGSTENRDGVEGSLVAQDIASGYSGINGTVTNYTGYNMDYFAVIWNDSLYVFENLPAGATCNLKAGEHLFGMSGGYYYSSYMYSFLEDFYDDGEYGKVSELSALGVGICDVYPQSDQDAFIVIGVVKDWNKTIDDNCSEVSYGCLYSIQ